MDRFFADKLGIHQYMKLMTPHMAFVLSAGKTKSTTAEFKSRPCCQFYLLTAALHIVDVTFELEHH